MLKQPQYSPMAIEEQVISLFAGVHGYLDKVSVSDIRKYQQTLLRHFEMEHKEFLSLLNSGEKLNKDMITEMHKILAEFTQAFFEESCLH